MLVVANAELIWTGQRELASAKLVCEASEVAQIIEGQQPARTEPANNQPTRTEPANGQAAGVEPANGQAARVEPASPPAANPPTPNGQAASHLDATGCLVIPGLINAHHHLLQSAFRTHPTTRQIPMRNWLSEMAKLYSQARIDPPFVAAAAAVGLAESLLNGVTTVADHHLTWPASQNPTEIATATVETASDLGIRLVFVHGTACGTPEQVATCIDELASRYGSASQDGMFQLAVGPAGIHSDTQDMFEAVSAVAKQHNLRRRTQANEQIDVEVAHDRYGQRPLELLAEWGWLAPDVTLAHLCDITQQERQLIAQSGASATHAPGCDVPMGWGIAEVGQLLDAGVSVGLGTSGGGSNDAGHLLADARLAMQISGLAQRPLSAKEALTMATAGSATGLARHSASSQHSSPLGQLEPGCAADFCCYDLSGLDDAGVADPLAGLLWASPGRKPRHVVVAGEILVQDWQLVNADARHLVASLDSQLRQKLG